MRRTELKRTTGLSRGGQMRRRSAKQVVVLAERRNEPGRAEWKTPSRGWCGVCGKSGWVIRHHVVYEQHVRAHKGDPWDQRNALNVGTTQCECHELHHKQKQKIPLSKLSDASIEFAVELMGCAALFYLRRRYYGRDERVELAVAELGAPDAAG